MLAAVGSTNPAKVRAVERVFSELMPGSTVKSVDTSSVTHAQPIELDQILHGALDRARLTRSIIGGGTSSMNSPTYPGPHEAKHLFIKPLMLRANMFAEQNKNLIRRIIDEVMNKASLTAAGELLAPNFTNHDFPMAKPGPEEFGKILQTFLTGFPDMHVTAEDSVAEGDRVFTRGYFTGTHTGVFQGIPPTGKKVTVKYMDEWRIMNGKATDNWVRIDMLSMMQQLGVVPPPP